MWWREVNYLGASVSRAGGGDQEADVSPVLASALENLLCAYFAVQSPPAHHNCGARHSSPSLPFPFFCSFSLFVIQRHPFFVTVNWWFFFWFFASIGSFFKIFCTCLHSRCAMVCSNHTQLGGNIIPRFVCLFTMY